MAHTDERLRLAGLRATRSRVAVLEVLDRAGDQGHHLVVADIAERSRALIGKVSTQAVYDCLDAMARAGVVRRVEPAGSPVRFETRVGDDHHHLACRTCGAVVDVDCVVGSPACLTPSSRHGFVVDEAEVLFWGTCPACAAPTTRAERTTA